MMMQKSQLLSQKMFLSDPQIFWCWHDAKYTTSSELCPDLMKVFQITQYELNKNTRNTSKILMLRAFCQLIHSKTGNQRAKPADPSIHDNGLRVVRLCANVGELKNHLRFDLPLIMT